MVSFIPNLDKIFCKKSLKSLALTAIMLSSLGLSLNSASASSVGPGCDPKFMDKMKEKAWMEAQREIMIAQTTIAKPDSVFSLGCFGHFTSGFSIGFGNGNNYNYSGLVNSYVSSAFNHTYGGGHYGGAGSNSGSNTNCTAMQSLWNAARKADLDQPSALLGTLNEFSTYNRGSFPTPYTPTGFAAPLATFYGAKVKGVVLGNATTGVPFDDMNLFAGVTAPQSQLNDTTKPNPKACAKGIATGVLFDTDRPEVICPNPGCVSDGTKTPKCCDYSTGNCSDPYP